MARWMISLCVLVLSIASSAAATVMDEPICCFCATDAIGGQVPFCALITNQEQESALGQQCDEAGGFGLKCLVMMDGSESSCNAALEAEGVNCPVRNGAPIASAPALGVLAAVFAALGVTAVRRRRGA